MTSPTPASDRAERRARSSGTSPRSERQAIKSIQVPLEHARWGHLGWALFGLVAGVLLLAMLGTVGQMLGVILLLVAAHNGYAFTRTLLYDSGTIAVDEERVVLPLGLCRGKTSTVPTKDVTHAFLLRRAVPWTRTGPLLIIEVAGHAYVYPRDWFMSENDQYRVLRAIRHHLGQEAP